MFLNMIIENMFKSEINTHLGHVLHVSVTNTLYSEHVTLLYGRRTILRGTDAL
jgi:hypothetical protein